MTTTRHLGLWESSTCCLQSAQWTQNWVPRSRGYSALDYQILEMNFPETHLVAKVDLSRQEAVTVPSAWGPAQLTVETEAFHGSDIPDPAEGMTSSTGEPP